MAARLKKQTSFLKDQFYFNTISDKNKTNKTKILSKLFIIGIIIFFINYKLNKKKKLQTSTT